MSELLEVQGLTKKFNQGRHSFVALQSISFSVQEGEILALVGESGSGKTTAARTIMGLMQPTGGNILWEGQDIFAPSFKRHGSYHRQAQVVFQNPFASLNPRYKAYYAVGEPLLIHGLVSRRQLRSKVQSLLRQVGLPEAVMDLYPHQLSGGECQRLALARSLALEPRMLVADEPTSSLDLLTQQKLLRLFLSLQRTRQFSMLFITHNLSILPDFADRIMVLYRGHLLEVSPTRAFFQKPHHPYSRLLLQALPQVGAASGQKNTEGDFVYKMRNYFPQGGSCPFYGICEQHVQSCSIERPFLRKVSPDRAVACHRPLA